MAIELVNALESYYERARDEVANAASALVELPAVDCDQELLLRTIELSETHRPRLRRRVSVRRSRRLWDRDGCLV
jgi:hypothetical protein